LVGTRTLGLGNNELLNPVLSTAVIRVGGSQRPDRNRKNAVGLALDPAPSRPEGGARRMHGRAAHSPALERAPSEGVLKSLAVPVTMWGPGARPPDQVDPLDAVPAAREAQVAAVAPRGKIQDALVPRAVALVPPDDDAMVPGLPPHTPENPGVQPRPVTAPKLGHGTAGSHGRGMAAAKRAAIPAGNRGLDQMRPPGAELRGPEGSDRPTSRALPTNNPASRQVLPPASPDPFGVGRPSTDCSLEDCRLRALDGAEDRNTPVIGLLLGEGGADSPGPFSRKQVSPLIAQAVVRGDLCGALRLMGRDPSDIDEPSREPRDNPGQAHPEVRMPGGTAGLLAGKDPPGPPGNPEAIGDDLIRPRKGLSHDNHRIQLGPINGLNRARQGPGSVMLAALPYPQRAGRPAKLRFLGSDRRGIRVNGGPNPDVLSAAGLIIRWPHRWRRWELGRGGGGENPALPKTPGFPSRGNEGPPKLVG
jgi:hypothetical protein